MSTISRSMRKTNSIASFFGLFIVGCLIALATFVSARVLFAIRSADELKEAFLATISHELRTPMNGVMGSIALIRDTSLDDEQRSLLDIAANSSGNMVKTVDEILTFSDFISGKPKINRSPFPLAMQLNLVLRQAEAECHKKGLSFTHDLKSIESNLVYCDHRKIIHVVRRILDNAVKFTPEGEVIFRISQRPNPDEDFPFILDFAVEDHGPGVKPELIEEIFKPFHELDGSFTRKHGGLGIGLAICKIIAQSLDGKLTFDNKPDGSGAIVTLSIPCNIEVEQQHESDLSFIYDSDFYTNHETQKKKALIVEDNKVNQLVLNKIIKKLDFDTIVANNGEEAVDKLGNEGVDIILMDCQMPVMDGYEATERIRSMDDEKRDIPIIAVTANARESDFEKCMQVGMNAFVNKPVDAKVIEKKMASLLKQNSGSDFPY